MKKLIILSLTLMLFAGILLAQKTDVKGNDMQPTKANMQNRPMNGDPMMMCMQEMKLTDAQMKKFEELKTGFTKTQNTAKAEIENLKIDMHSALKAEKFTEAKAMNKQMFAKKNMLGDARIDFMAARMKELTPDQKEIMKKHMMQFQGGRHMMRGKGMMNGKDNDQMHRQGMMNRKGNDKDCGNCNDDHGQDNESNHNPKMMHMK